MTKQRIKFLCLAASLTLAPNLMAQGTTGPDYFFKMRGEAGATTTAGYRNSFGVGAGANLDMGHGNALGLELGYGYMPGNIFRIGIPANTIGATDLNSMITEKHSAEALGARANWTTAIDADWSWHFGLGLYAVKATMESVADFEGTLKTDGGWTTSVQKSTVMVEPFIGVGYKVTQSGSLEFDLAYSSFKTPDVSPVFTPAGANYHRVAPAWGEQKVSNAKLVITYVFHF